MNIETLLAELDACTKNFLEILGQFNKSNFIQKRSENEWSPAQIAEHLLLLEITANKAITGTTIPTNRTPDKKVPLIKWAMEDTTKRVAPESVLPSDRITDAETAIEKITQQRGALREAITSLDLSEACMLFKHPALGTLTRLEWIYFTIYHMQRHLQQMKE
ncbi:MAG TPA: DinB family protein, partial [Flavisolibacter sp.]|nr:DinB family protein [Flavisolibacter sp.]